MKIICKFGFNYEIHKKEKEKKSPPPPPKNINYPTAMS